MKKPIDKAPIIVLMIALLTLALIATSVTVLLTRFRGDGDTQAATAAQETTIKETTAAAAASTTTVPEQTAPGSDTSLERARAQYQEKLEKYETDKRDYDAFVVSYNAAAKDFKAGLDRFERAKSDYEMAQATTRVGESAVRLAKGALDSGDPQRIRNAASILAMYFADVDENVTPKEFRAAVAAAEKDLEVQKTALAEAASELAAGEKKLAEGKAHLDLLVAQREAALKQLQQAKTALDAEYRRIKEMEEPLQLWQGGTPQSI